MSDIDTVLTRGVDQILPSRDGLSSLMEEKKIALYQGFDPSMANLHLGHLVGLRKLAQFQKLGHKVIFLVGDFTGMIGDPTDKLSARRKLTRKEVLANTVTWKEQAGRVLDFEGDNKASFMFNSEWLDKLTFKDLIEYCSYFTVQQMLERDMFKKRLESQKPIYLHEFLYPVAQAIDSLKMKVDLEVGGNDQMFNMLAGRSLVGSVDGREKYVLTTKLITDNAGEKAGKTTGNALFLNSTPEEFYGGIMSFSDETLLLSFELLTDLELDKLEEKIKKDPMEQKKILAFDVVKQLWSESDAKKAQSVFEKTFQEKSPQYDKKLKAKKDLISTIEKLVGSKSEAKRLIAQGAVDVNDKSVDNPLLKVKTGDKIKIGKRIFVRIE